jgi:3-oxoacyl-[acyl-carrier protein] reductase
MTSNCRPIKGGALVTGASRGIGKVVALRLAALGLPVAINYRASKVEAEALVQTIRLDGGEAIALQADMADRAQAEQVVLQSHEHFGSLSVLVNNAGITRDRLLLQMSEDDWDATWKTDLVGARVAARTALKCMNDLGGRIINISSVVGVTGNAGQANYAAAKAAVCALTRELAVQGASRGVTVNCVIPGYITTDATSHLNKRQRENLLDRIPMRRSAQPEDVAEAIVFLASETTGYITGQCLAVDGGLLAAAGSGMAS